MNCIVCFEDETEVRKPNKLYNFCNYSSHLLCLDCYNKLIISQFNKDNKLKCLLCCEVIYENDVVLVAQEKTIKIFLVFSNFVMIFFDMKYKEVFFGLTISYDIYYVYKLLVSKNKFEKELNYIMKKILHSSTFLTIGLNIGLIMYNNFMESLEKIIINDLL